MIGMALFQPKHSLRFRKRTAKGLLIFMMPSDSVNDPYGPGSAENFASVLGVRPGHYAFSPSPEVGGRGGRGDEGYLVHLGMFAAAPARFSTFVSPCSIQRSRSIRTHPLPLTAKAASSTYLQVEKGKRFLGQRPSLILEGPQGEFVHGPFGKVRGFGPGIVPDCCPPPFVPA